MPTLEEQKAMYVAEVHALHSLTLDTLTGNATDEEQKTWPAKAKAAQAFFIARATPAQIDMLEKEAALKGKDVEDLADSIADKDDIFQTLIGLAAGMRDKSLRGIEAADSEAVLLATIEAVRSEAEAFTLQLQAQIAGA